jgi:hypothetical protein
MQAVLDALVATPSPAQDQLDRLDLVMFCAFVRALLFQLEASQS